MTQLNPTLRYIDTDIVYVIGTVGMKKRNYELRIRPPKHLAQNQFAYELKIPIDSDKWKERVKEVKLSEIEPPGPPKLKNTASFVERDTVTKVLDTLKEASK